MLGDAAPAVVSAPAACARRPRRARAAAGDRRRSRAATAPPPRRARARTAAAPPPRIERALAAWHATHPPARSRRCSTRLAAQPTYSVTELETFQTCSSLWFVERKLHPRDVEQPLDAAHRRQRDAQRAPPLLQRRAVGVARAAAAPGAPAGRLRPARPLHRRPPSRRRRTRTTTSPGRRCAASCGAICARSCAARPTGSTSSSRGTSRSRCRPSGVRVGGRADHGPHRPRRRARVGRRGADLGLQVRRGRRPRAERARAAAGCSCRSTSAPRAELLGRDVVGGLYQSVRATRRRAGCCATTCARPGALEGFAAHDYVEPELVRAAARRGRRARRRVRRAHQGGGRAARPAGRRVPVVVPLARRLPGGEPMSAVLQPELSDQQLAAVEARGEIFVAAGAGTGKTTLVIERVRAALETGTAPERVLVVTYTEAAARELAAAARARVAGAATDAARPQVGTIHALAARLLREYAAEAGLPAELRVLDEAEALVLSEAAFARRDRARAPRRAVRRCSTCSASTASTGTRALIRSLDARLRAAGGAGAAAAAAARGPAAARAAARRGRGGRARSSPATRARRRPSDLRRLARIEAVLAGRADRPRAARARRRRRARPPGAVGELLAAAQEEARRAPGARGRGRPWPRCSSAIAPPTARARRPRSRSTSTTSQERACELLERDADRRGGARALRPRARRRVPGHERPAVPPARRARRAPTASASSWATPASRSTASATPTSSCSARAASARAGGACRLTGNYRSRPELLAVIGHVFAERFDERDFEPPLAAAHRRADGRARAIELHLVARRGAPARAGAGARARGRRARARACASSSTAACRAGDIAILLRSARDASIYAAALERVGADGAQPARPRLLRLAAGTRPVRLPRAAAQPLRRPRAARRARLAARRRLERRAGRAAHARAQRALYWPIELGQLEGLPEADRALVERFQAASTTASCGAGGELGLAALLERIVDEHDYELACLAAPDGERRFGNVRKLVRPRGATRRSRPRPRGLPRAAAPLRRARPAARRTRRPEAARTPSR